MRYRIVFLLSFLTTSLMAGANLDLYFIDVEGGQSTLIVAPSGESMLVDAGYPGFDGRDAGRIIATAKRAGLSEIDYLLITHYHGDHVGGVPALAEKFPIVHFVDHGDNTEAGERADQLANLYYQVRERGKHVIAKPGDQIPLQGVQVDVVSARGELIQKPLPGAGAPNPSCGEAPKKRKDTNENGRSVGFVLNYGKFRFVDLGDLTWNFELDLVCPVNKLGDVDVYLTSHHGLPQSGSPQLLHALKPRVAVLNNGPGKGGDPEAIRVIQKSPGLLRLWQLYYAVKAGDLNAPDHYIANIVGGGPGHGIHIKAQSDGSFTVVNERTGYREEYGPSGR